MACCCSDDCDAVEGAIDEFGNFVQIYRKSCPYDTLAKVFDADDCQSFTNWHIDLSTDMWNPKNAAVCKYPPRFRELIDPETKMHVVDLTGNHDGSVYMIAPPLPHMFLVEKLPVINFILNDRGAYSSIEITMLTREDSYPCESSGTKIEMRTVWAKNFISRTCIRETSMEIPMRLKPSWNYASLDLQQLVRDAWNAKYLATTRIKINANIRLRTIYFSDREYAYHELPIELKMNLKQVGNVHSNKSNNSVFKTRRLKSGKEEIKDDSNSTNLEDEVHQAMRLSTSVPSNVEALKKLVKPVRKSIIDGNTTLTLDYPMSRKAANIRKARKQIPVLISIGEQMREDLSQAASPNLYSKDSRNSLEGFCSYVWKEQSTSNVGGEWRKIEQITIQPKVVARTNKSRVKEGLYDLFTGRMMTKKDQKFFGFGDKLETTYLSKKKSEKRVEVKRENCLDTMKKNLETVMSEDPSQARMSHVDRNGDMEFLQRVSKDIDPSIFEEEGEASEEYEGEHDHGQEYEGEGLFDEEPENLCSCVCPCNCKAKRMWKQSNLTPEQKRKMSNRASLAQEMYQLLRFVPPPSKHLRPQEELRGTGATLLQPFLGKANMP